MRWENGFVGALLRREMGAWCSKSRALGQDRFLASKSRVFGVPGRLRLFPRLRCKSGLCYTAGANSPFEAYIYVR
jgi:hypothetical protein